MISHSYIVEELVYPGKPPTNPKPQTTSSHIYPRQFRPLAVSGQRQRAVSGTVIINHGLMDNFSSITQLSAQTVSIGWPGYQAALLQHKHEKSELYRVS